MKRLLFVVIALVVGCAVAPAKRENVVVNKIKCPDGPYKYVYEIRLYDRQHSIRHFTNDEFEPGDLVEIACTVKKVGELK